MFDKIYTYYFELLLQMSPEQGGVQHESFRIEKTDAALLSIAELYSIPDKEDRE